MEVQFEGQTIIVPDDATDAEISDMLSTLPPTAAAAPAQSAPNQSPITEVELPDGTIAEFPAGTSPDVMREALRKRFPSPVPAWDQRGASGVPGSNATTAAVPKPEPTTMDHILGALDYADNTGAIFLDHARKGISQMASLPGLAVDAVNNAPRLANLLPGVDGVGPISKNPIGGSENIESIVDTGLQIPSMAGKAGYDALADALGSNSHIQLNQEPADAFQRVVGRIGKEVGATAVPVAGAIGKASQMTMQEIRNAGPVARMFLEPAKVAPANLVGKEAKYAVGSGTGAGVANEVAGNSQDGDNFWSELFGSIGGASVTGIGSKVASSAKGLVAAAAGRGDWVDDIVGQEVADRLINNSTDLAQQYAETGAVDTGPLASKLRAPSEAERIIPGFKANIGDRSQDPMLQTWVQNQDMLSPGAANVRRTANETAVDDLMHAIAPQGDAAQFRASLDVDRDRRILEAIVSRENADTTFRDANIAIAPTMPVAAARGSSLRAGLQDAYDNVRNAVSDLYEPINNSRDRVDIAPLRDRFAEIDNKLPLNDRTRFRPAEANVPAQLAPESQKMPAASSILDASGAPFRRQQTPVDTTVPLNEITSARSGLSQDLRQQRGKGQRQAARITQQYQSGIDEYLANNLPDDMQQKYEAARAARADQADRFERPGTAIAETLKPRQGGGYQLDDSAIASRFTPTDNGRVDDLRAALREAGTDPRVRNAISDEVSADVQAKGLVDRPEALDRYLGERGILLNEFPELRSRLEAVRETRRNALQAERTANETERRLNTPGRSAQASYLKFGNEATVDAVRNLVSGPQPREATRELLEAAGNSPEARLNARSALWEAVKTRKMDAPGSTGNDRWNGKKLKAMFDDPKTAAVADELWSDYPEDLANIKRVFNALAGVEGSTRTRAAGSSGTAQALSGKFEPSLTAGSIASRVRSVKRGVLSVHVALIDGAATWLRGRSAKVQSRAIDTLASSVANNPGLAADLLEKFNPADFAAKRRMITQKYGVRATQLLNLIDESRNSDETVDAATEDAR